MEEKEVKPKYHRPVGVIYVSQNSHPELSALLDLSSTDIQGKLRDDGKFDRIHQLLLLPASYTVIAVFCDYVYGTWRIIVESDAIPRVNPGENYPTVEPHYSKNYTDGTVRLNDIQATITTPALNLNEMLRSLSLKEKQVEWR